MCLQRVNESYSRRCRCALSGRWPVAIFRLPFHCRTAAVRWRRCAKQTFHVSRHATEQRTASPSSLFRRNIWQGSLNTAGCRRSWLLHMRLVLTAWGHLAAQDNLEMRKSIRTLRIQRRRGTVMICLNCDTRPGCYTQPTIDQRVLRRFY